jgi:hypothetical protein
LNFFALSAISFKFFFSDVFYKQQTWDFVNRTVAALSVLAIGSHHSSEMTLFMEGHTPEHVLETLLEWLRSLSLSDRTSRVLKVRFAKASIVGLRIFFQKSVL